MNSTLDQHPALDASKAVRPSAQVLGIAALAAVGFVAFNVRPGYGLAVYYGLALVALGFAAALAGESRLVFFALGLSATGAVVDGVVGAPTSLVFLVAVGFAYVLRSMASGRAPYVEVASLGAVILVALYWVIQPPGLNASWAAALGLLLLPLGIAVLRGSSQVKPGTGRQILPWYAAGCALSIGSALVDVYIQLGSGYAQYEQARVFESAIGSSNHAAALAIVPGLLLVSIPVNTKVLLVASRAAAVLFLAAPVVFASRGAFAAALIGLLVVARIRLRLRTGVLVAIAAAASWPLLLGSTFQGSFLWQRLSSVESSAGYISGRGEIWSETFQLFLSEPLLGVGPGGLTDILLPSMGVAYSHQFILEVFAQLGAIMGLVYLWSVRPKPLRKLSPATPILMAIFANSMIEPVLPSPQGAVAFSAVVAAHYWWFEQESVSA